jgi:hypothetical protein
MEPWAEADIEESFRTIGMQIALNEGFVHKEDGIWMDDQETPKISIWVPRHIGGGYLEVRPQYYTTSSDTGKFEMAHKGQCKDTRWQGKTHRNNWTDRKAIDRDEIIADARNCTAFKLWVHTINTWTGDTLYPEPDVWSLPMWIVKEGGDEEKDEDWEVVDYIQLPESDPEPETATPGAQEEQLDVDYIGIKAKQKSLPVESPVSLGSY